MNKTKQLSALLFSFLLLALSSWYFIHREKTVFMDAEWLSAAVDTTITQLTVRQFDEEGVLSNVLKTPLMQHIPKEDVNLLETPQVLIGQKDQTPWEIQSKKAKSLHGGKQIIFMQDVVVHQKAGAHNAESTLKTEAVLYLPKEKKAVTDLLVTFEQQGNVIQSRGMNAYLEEKRVELLHQASGSYMPNSAESARKKMGPG